jgi:hypothetical protein
MHRKLLYGVLFGGLHRVPWYHSSLVVSRNAPRIKGMRLSAVAAVATLWIFFHALSSLRAGELPLPVASTGTAKVLTVCDRTAIEAYLPRQEVVRAMVDRAITNFTGKSTVAQAWLSLVSTQDVIGIKVYSAPGAHSGTRPAVVASVVEGLLSAGLPPQHIIVWDKQTTDLRLAGYFDLAKRYGIRAESSAQTGYDLTNFYDNALIGNLVWGDVEFGQKAAGVGRKSYFSKLVSQEITKIINISPLLNHNSAGVSGNLYSLATGSVDNVARFEADPARLATAIPEIYALPPLSDRVVLNIVDALICQYEGGEKGYLNYSATLDELRFSRDPVALDILSLRELDHQRELAKAPPVKPNLDLYGNATLLELGVDEVKRIHVERLQ